MAYGNWGAFVYKNGERMPSREDNTPYREDDLEPGYHQAFGRSSETGFNPVHASLGNGPFRLIGYKAYPQIQWNGEDIDIKQFAIDEDKGDSWYWYESAGLKGEYNGYKFTAYPHDSPESVELWLQEPDGTVWTGRSGYCIGRGHDD